MGREARVGRRDAALVISKRFPVTVPGIGPALGAAFAEVYAYAAAEGIVPDGPPFVIYHDVPHGDEPIDVEVCAPVRATDTAPAGWRAQELPAGLFATLMHVGTYDGIGATYGELTEWLGTHGLALAGPPREVYLSEPGTPPEETRTVVEFPVMEAPAPVPAG